MKSAAQTVNYGYEPSGRYTIEEGGQTTRYTFDARGNTKLVEMSDNSTIAMGYDERSRLKTMVHKNAANAVLLSQVYTLNARGLRTGIQENYGVAPSAVQRTHSYHYDQVARLTGVSVTGASLTQKVSFMTAQATERNIAATRSAQSMQHLMRIIVLLARPVRALVTLNSTTTAT